MMIAILACLICTILFFIAVLHLYWAFGGFWPAQNRSELPQAVVGTENASMPSNGLTLLVAVLVLTAGFVPILWIKLITLPIDREFQALAMSMLTLIFLARGALTYTPFANSYSVIEPFVTLNRKFYSPLCLAIGLGFLMLRFY